MTFCQFQVQHGDCAKYCSSRRCIDRPCIQNIGNESLKINLKQNFILLTDILLSYTLKLNTLIYDMDSLSLNVGECRQLSICSLSHLNWKIQIWVLTSSPWLCQGLVLPPLNPFVALVTSIDVGWGIGGSRFSSLPRDQEFLSDVLLPQEEKWRT